MRRAARAIGYVTMGLVLLIVLLPPAGKLAGWGLDAIGWWFYNWGFYLR